MIKFKYPKDLPDFDDLDPRLAEIVYRIDEVVWALGREDVTVTSIYRQDGSTHSNPPPYRFIDLRVFKNIDNNWLRDWINKEFPYDGRKGIYTVAPLNHGTAPHFHIQVSPI